MAEQRLIKVQIIEHRKTGLLVGISDDLKGLYVHGRSVAELDTRIPLAIKELLEADGKHNVVVHRVEEDADADDGIPAAFSKVPSSRTFTLAA